MAPNNTSTKMSVDFDLTDIEDIDAISDEFDADPSSDDDTFISNKNKKITKKREKRGTIVKNISSNNEAQVIPNFEANNERTAIFSNITKFNEVEDKNKGAPDSEDDDNIVIEKRADSIIKLNAPTDHFNELEKKMNGDGWMMTSSSATQSEDELGAGERNEFAFKMCQIIRRSGKKQEKRKKRQLKHEKVERNLSEDTLTTKTESSKAQIHASEGESSEGENMLKFCSRDVPLAALNEDEL